MNSIPEISRFIRESALAIGFASVGFSKAEELTEEGRRLEAWLSQGKHGSMSYLENYFDKRIDPRKLVPGAKSVISLSYNYYTESIQEDPSAPKIATYAYGRDYHKVVKKKLKYLLNAIIEKVGEVTARIFVDSAPVMEREWAVRGGLGWMGKNTLLIDPRKGSYFFLAEIIIDIELDYDHAIRDHCGTCTRCIDACPTDAFSEEGYVLDASKCISYLTIERKEAIPVEFSGKMAQYMFGCDICQQVCPWNKFAKVHDEPDFIPKQELLSKTNKEWVELTEDVYNDLFQGSAVKRTKFKGLKRNINFLKEE